MSALKQIAKGVVKTPSPLRYPGGKSVLGLLVKGFLVQHKLLGCEFAESFAGGAGLGLSLLFNGVISKLHLNDLDARLYSFWQALLKCNGDFIDKLSHIEVSLAEYDRQKHIMRTASPGFELGFASFYVNRANFSGLLEAGPIGGAPKKASGSSTTTSSAMI
ncbi:hypothetical protein [Helicobacter sp. L8]|uniref:hypothetical protein n=1 Tax=Helicobacter sp. L8 TaxID=2316078 RepID=UPI000EB36BF9|nr:hypothetical protein [Helicobacter sp. L8]